PGLSGAAFGAGYPALPRLGLAAAAVTVACTAPAAAVARTWVSTVTVAATACATAVPWAWAIAVAFAWGVAAPPRAAVGGGGTVMVAATAGPVGLAAGGVGLRGTDGAQAAKTRPTMSTRATEPGGHRTRWMTPESHGGCAGRLLGSLAQSAAGIGQL